MLILDLFIGKLIKGPHREILRQYHLPHDRLFDSSLSHGAVLCLEHLTDSKGVLHEHFCDFVLEDYVPADHLVQVCHDGIAYFYRLPKGK